MLRCLRVQFRQTENSWRLDRSHRRGNYCNIPCVVDAATLCAVVRPDGEFHFLDELGERRRRWNKGSGRQVEQAMLNCPKVSPRLEVRKQSKSTARLCRVRSRMSAAIGGQLQGFPEAD
jgi:hypothetical protein